MADDRPFWAMTLGMEKVPQLGDVEASGYLIVS